MEYQKIINLLDDTTNQAPKFRTRNLPVYNLIEYNNAHSKTSGSL